MARLVGVDEDYSLPPVVLDKLDEDYVSAIVIKGAGIDPDGVEDSSDAIASKIAMASNLGLAVYWPEGTYITGESIPFLHTVKHSGPGVLRRGTSIFHLAPSRENINRIHVSPNGSDVNDGLSTAQPLATIQAAFDAVRKYGPVLSGSWRIILAAGTYTSPAQAVALETPDELLTIQGPAVNYGTPTAIIEPGVGATYGLWFGHGMRFVLRDVILREVRGSGVASPVVLDYHTYGWLDNVHTSGYTWAGVNANIGCRLVVSGGNYGTGTDSYGIRVYGGSTATIGYNAQRVTVGAVGGVIYQGFSYGHTDNTNFVGCDTGLIADIHSHTTNYGNVFTGCNVGIQTSNGSTIGSDDATTYTGVTIQSRHRDGYATGDDEQEHRYAEQYRTDLGTGRFARGYPTWHTPWVKHQFTGDTQTDMNLSGFAPAAMLLETGGNTIYALAAKGPNYSALWFGDEVNSSAFQFRFARANGGMDVMFDGSSAYRFRSTDFWPTVNDVKELGRSAFRWLNVWAKQFRPGTAGTAAPIWTSGVGTPEGVLSARIGSIYAREDGAANTTLYVKESGTGNTGWVAK